MIYLNAPYQVVQGYTVLPDHENPYRRYVLPSAPRLSRAPDGQPAFALTEYLGGGTGTATVSGGVLTLTTELSVPDETLIALQHRLAPPTGRPRAGTLDVMPVLFDEGTVELIAFGESSVRKDGDSSTKSGPLGIRILGAGKPSLGGANRATFQLILDATAAELVERAMDAPDLPLIAVYRMTFVGLRPSFQIDIQADWRKVYRSLENRASGNFYYVAADAEALVSDAIEENGIRIDTTLFGTGDGARAAAERARKQLIDWTLQHLFTPMVDPQSATANAVGKAIDDTVWSLARAVLPGVTYRLRVVDEHQLRTLSTRMNEVAAEKQEVVPQGTLGGILQPYRVGDDGTPKPEWSAMRKALLQKINLDGFPRLDVKIAVEDRFATDGLAEVRVELARVREDNQLADHRTFAFRNAAERKDYVVNLLGEARASFAVPYRYRTEVLFDSAGPFGPHPSVTSDWEAGNTTELFVEPRCAYMLREVKVNAAPTFSFAQFPNVSVELRYDAEGERAVQTGHFQLTRDQPSQVWRYRTFAATTQPYGYRVTYQRVATAGGSIEGSWHQQVDGWLAIPDPLPLKRALTLFVNLPWSELNLGFVQLRYNDPANGIRYDEQVDLTADTRYLRRDYPIASTGPRTIAYRLTLLLTSGALLEGSWRETEDERLVLDRRLVERKVVTVRTVAGKLAENRLAEVHVLLQVREPQSEQVRAETEIRLTPENEGRSVSWEYLLGDPPVKKVYFSAVFVDPNGFTQRTPWESTEADLLVVHLSSKSVRA